jgi:hypothetical protein
LLAVAGLDLHPMKSVLFIFIIVLCLQACKKQESITQEDVIAVLNKFDEGWRSKQALVVDSVLSPSYIYFTQSGGTFSRANVVHTAGSDDYKVDTVYRKHYEIKIEGNTAVVNTVWVGKGSYFGKPFNDRQRCSVTMVKRDGRVQILSEHCTPIK